MLSIDFSVTAASQAQAQSVPSLAAAAGRRSDAPASRAQSRGESPRHAMVIGSRAMLIFEKCVRAAQPAPHTCRCGGTQLQVLQELRR